MLWSMPALNHKKPSLTETGYLNHRNKILCPEFMIL